MPYTKLGRSQKSALYRLLKGLDITGDEMARALGCSVRTGYRRLNDPESMTVKELLKLSRAAHISIEEIRGAIS